MYYVKIFIYLLFVRHVYAIKFFNEFIKVLNNAPLNIQRSLIQLNITFKSTCAQY